MKWRFIDSGLVALLGYNIGLVKTKSFHPSTFQCPFSNYTQCMPEEERCCCNSCDRIDDIRANRVVVLCLERFAVCIVVSVVRRERILYSVGCCSSGWPVCDVVIRFHLLLRWLGLLVGGLKGKEYSVGFFLHIQCL